MKLKKQWTFCHIFIIGSIQVGGPSPPPPDTPMDRCIIGSVRHDKIETVIADLKVE